jgi:hypothetical protein
MAFTMDRDGGVALLVPLLVLLAAPHVRLANTGDQRVNRSWRLGNLVPAGAGWSSRQRRPRLGVDGSRLGCRNVCHGNLAAHR